MLREGRGTCDQVVSKDGDVVLTKWVDNRSVIMASNFVGVGNIDTVKARPEVIKLYNYSMGGVDLLDQMISLYRIYI